MLKLPLQGSLVFKKTKLDGKMYFWQECPACNVQVIWMNGVIFKKSWS